MTRLVVFTVLLCVWTPLSWAQAPHQHLATATIDGSVSPDQIADSVAYRLYLLAVSTNANPAEGEQRAQRAHLMRTGLSGTDQQAFISILLDFRGKHDALVNEYNNLAKAAAARNLTPDIQSLLTKLDDLVQSTRDTIIARLSTQGAARLHSFVLAEKKNMKVQGDQ